MDPLFSDLRLAARQLLRTPGFTAAGLITLALGIGANTAIFSVFNAVLLRPLSYPEPDRLVSLCETTASIPGAFCIVSPPSADAWQQRARSVTSVGIARGTLAVRQTGAGTESVRGAYVTPGLFAALGHRPFRGRLLTSEDFTGPAVMISYEYWQNAFGGTDAVIGRTMVLDEAERTVVGVLERDATVPDLRPPQVWLPLPFMPDDPEWESWGWFVGLARLRDGVPAEEARQELAAIQATLADSRPEVGDDWDVAVPGVLDNLVGPVRPTLRVLLGVVAFVLLIAVVNVTNLILVRASRRSADQAVRVALGAGSARLMRIPILESCLLTGIGAAAGLGAGVLGTRLLLDFAPEIPRLEATTIDSTVLLFTAMVAIVVAVVSGAVPAWSASRLDPASTMSAANVQRAGGGRSRTRDGLVVLQVALTLVLLIGAGLLGRTLLGYVRWDPGFVRDGLLVSFFYSSDGKYPTSAEVLAAHEGLVEAVRSLPGVGSASLASAGPAFGGRESASFRIVGEPAPVAGQDPVLRWFDVGPEYFETLRLPILQGRSFTASDRRDAPFVAILNETAARRLTPDGAIIGRQITALPSGPTFEIVGVAQDVRPLRPGSVAEPEIYWPYAQMPRWGSNLVVRVDGEPGQQTRAIETRLQEIDPDAQFGGFATLDDLAGREAREPTFNVSLVGAFAVIAVILSLVGISGVLGYSVSQRTHEIGVRIAVGASPGAVMRSVVLRGMTLTAVGLVLGATGAAVLSGWLQSLLHGVSAMDGWTYVGAAAAFSLVAGLAAAQPARRAARVDPLTALRSD